MTVESDAEPFKQLTRTNWQQPDPTLDGFQRLDGSNVNADHWAELVLRYELDAGVPAEVRDLWAVARGTMLYGYFFYPLWALGDEQLHRVVDAAVGHAYRRFSGPTSDGGPLPPFNSRIEWLIAQRYIDPRWTPRWQAIKDLRNMGSHPERASIAMPNEAIRSLALFRDEINRLFASDEPQFVGTTKWRPPLGAESEEPKRVSVGDRYQLAGELQNALDHFWSARELSESDADLVAARLIIERTRDRLLGLSPPPVEGE